VAWRYDFYLLVLKTIFYHSKIKVISSCRHVISSIYHDHWTCWNNLATSLIISSSLVQVVNSLFQNCWQLGTSSANTTCNWRQTCYEMWDSYVCRWDFHPKLDGKHVCRWIYIRRVSHLQCRARNNVPNVPDHGDRQSRLFADQIKIWPIRSICLSSLEKIEKIR
jgi:hypothetical protein